MGTIDQVDGKRNADGTPPFGLASRTSTEAPAPGGSAVKDGFFKFSAVDGREIFLTKTSPAVLVWEGDTKAKIYLPGTQVHELELKIEKFDRVLWDHWHE